MILANVSDNPFVVCGIVFGIVVVLLSVFFAIKRSKFSILGGKSEFLCDSCKYNDQRYCSVAERPNVKKCDDYKSIV